MDKITGSYFYTRKWFDFAFSNQDKICPTHTAMFLWFVELQNRMGWVESFASPASQTMAAIGLKSYNTYKKVFDELVDFGFIKLVMKSENQYTACIIALSNFDKSLDKSLDKALMNHLTNHCTNQSETTVQTTNSIIKPKTINHKPKTSKVEGGSQKFSPPSQDDVQSFFKEKVSETSWTDSQIMNQAKRFIDFYDSKNWMIGKNKMSKWKSAASGWINRSQNFNNDGKANSNTTKKSTQQNRSELQNLSDRSEEFLRVLGSNEFQ